MTSVLQVPGLEIWMSCAQINRTNYPFCLILFLISFYPLASRSSSPAFSRSPSHVPRLVRTRFCKRGIVSCMHVFLVSVNRSLISYVFFHSAIFKVHGRCCLWYAMVSSTESPCTLSQWWTLPLPYNHTG